MVFIESNNLTQDYYSFIRYLATYLTLAICILFVIGVCLYFVLLKSTQRKQLLFMEKQININLSKIAQIEKRANTAKTDFLSRISHDIRTPMNGILGMTNIAKNNINNKEKIVDCLNKISSTSTHLLGLINNVLDMSKIENGKIELTNKIINLKEFASSCADVVESQVINSNILFRSCFDFEHNLIYTDETHLRQILINVLGNAIKFTPSGKSIDFIVKETNCENNIVSYVFIIEDTGIGMNKEFLNHIFEPFVQEDESSARTNYSGSGLGMAIVKELVELFGGTINVSSVEGKGTKVSIKLNFEIAEGNASIKTTKYTKIDLKKMRILVVEDNEINLEIAKSLLEDVGVIVEEASNGQIAIDKFTASNINYYDAILMDVMMPVLNGIEATKMIRALERSDAKTIPIIAMTANAYKEDVENVLSAGMNEHIAKPIETEILYEKLLLFKDKK